MAFIPPAPDDAPGTQYGAGNVIPPAPDDKPGETYVHPVYAQEARAKAATAEYEQKLAKSKPKVLPVQASNWEELATAFGTDPKVIGLNKGQQIFDYWKELQGQEPQSGLGLVKKLARQGSSLWRGSQQGLYNILGNKSESEAARLYENIVRYDKARKGEGGLLSFATETALDAPFMVGLPGGPIMGVGERAGANIAKSALSGAATGFVSPTVGENPLAERSIAAGIGAVAAPLVQRYAAEPLMELGSRAFTGAFGSLPPEIAERARIFREMGFEPTATELDPTQAKLSGLKDIISNAPSGLPGDINMTRMNRRNLMQAPLAVGTVAAPARMRAVSEPFSGVAVLEDLAAKGNDQAKVILSKIQQAQGRLESGSGQTGLGETMAADIEANVFAAKHGPEGVNAARAAENALMPQKPIDTQEALAAVRDAIGREVGGNQTNRSSGLLNELRNIENDLQTLTSGDVNLVSSIPQGAPVVGRPGTPEVPALGGDASLGIQPTGRGPVVGGRGPQDEVRDVYGTVITPAAPASSGAEVSLPQRVGVPAGEPTLGVGPSPVPVAQGQTSYARLNDLYNRILALQSDFTSPRAVFVNASEAGKLGPIREVVKRLRDQAANLPENADFLAARENAANLAKSLLSPAGAKTPTDLAAASSEGLGDTFTRKLIDMTPDQLGQLIAPMGEKGRKAAVISILDDAVRGMRNAGPEAINFDQQAATMQLRKALDALRVVGTPAEQTQVKALEMAISSLTQMGNIHAKPFSFTKLYAAIPGIAKFLLTTDAGKRMAFALSASRSGSPAQQALLQKLEQMVGMSAVDPTSQYTMSAWDINQ